MTTDNVIPYASKMPKPMTPKDVFGVIVRTIGLLILLYGVYTSCYAVLAATGAPSRGYSPGTFALYGCVYTVIGLLLLRGNWIANFAYGRG